MSKTLLILGKEIPFMNGFNVRQLSIEEIASMGDGVFESYLIPYVLTIDALFDSEEEAEKVKANRTMFQLFFQQTAEGLLLDSVFGGRNTLEFVKSTIALFLGIEESKITILKNRNKFAIQDGSRELLLDDESYSKLREIIQMMHSREDVEVERPPKDMTERQQDIWKKLQEGRKRRQSRESLKLGDIINLVAFGGNSYIPFDAIARMTYFQLYRAYKNVMSRDSYELGMSYKLSQKFDYKDEVKHWAKDFKL